MPAHFTGVTPLLIVESVEPTRAFFVDRLGFQAVWEMAYGDGLGFSIVQGGNVRIMLQSDALSRADAGENYVPGPYKSALHLHVDNVEALIPQVADADVVRPLRRTPYGMHEIAVREPGGNVIVFSSPLAP